MKLPNNENPLEWHKRRVPNWHKRRLPYQLSNPIRNQSIGDNEFQSLIETTKDNEFEYLEFDYYLDINFNK